MKKTIKRKTASKGAQIRFKGLMDRVAAVEKTVKMAEMAKFSPGDTVKVHVRIKEGEKERIQIYEGVVIARANRGTSRSFIVRKISHGVGVERVFLESSPKLAKVELVQAGKVRRAKLYYLRALEGKAAKIDREIENQTAVASTTTSGSAPAKK